MSGSSSSTSFAATGAFYITNGKIIDPHGVQFLARGIDVMEGQQPSASTLLSDFPGINFVRLAIYDYASPAALASYVNSLTLQGMVVELEDHNNNAGSAGAGAGTIFTGAALKTELNWYSSVATAFKSNPNVWFGTNNEPSETDASGNTDPAALSAWQQQTYQAIRNTGENSPIMVELNTWGPSQTGIGYTPTVYASMNNIVWDIHYYGWLSGYSTNQATVSQTLSGIVSSSRSLTSANGIVPVMVGEYGNTTTNPIMDPNANQVITAVQRSGLSNAAWAWGPGSPGNGLSDGGTGLSAYGRQVAAGIAAAAAASGPMPSPTPPPPVATVSTLALNVSEDAWQGDAQFTVKVDGTQVGGVQTTSALHSSGDSEVVSLTGEWSAGVHMVQIQFINDAYGGSSTTDRNLYVNSIALNGVSARGTTAAMNINEIATFAVGGTTPTGLAPIDKLTLNLAEDAWNGNAQFTLTIDGKQISMPQDVAAAHSAGAWAQVSFAGNFGPGSHTVGVAFTNDAYGGKPSEDRNLYVNGIDVNGYHYGKGTTTLLVDSVVQFTIATAH